MPRKPKGHGAPRTRRRDIQKQDEDAMKMHAPKCQKRDLPDLKKRLIAYGIYDEYVAWQRNYISWRKGQASGAKGEATSSRLEHSAWRDGYRRWRQGAITGAKGEAGDTTSAQKAISNEAAMFYDVVANEHGQPLLVPINGPAVTPMPIELFPPDALVTVRVFRFFENRNDASEPWERGVQPSEVFWVCGSCERHDQRPAFEGRLLLVCISCPSRWERFRARALESMGMEAPGACRAIRWEQVC